MRAQLNNAGFFDNDGFSWHVAMTRFAGSFNFCNFIDNVHAFNYFAEHAIAPATSKFLQCGLRNRYRQY